MTQEQSIFVSTKAMLDIADDDPSFDRQIVVFINSALSDLLDLGAGPPDGLAITGDTEEWDALGENPTDLERIKDWIYLKAKLRFDPPQTQFLMTAHQDQIKEATWRIVNKKDFERELASTIIDQVTLDGGVI